MGLGRQGRKLAAGFRESGHRVVGGCDLRPEVLGAFGRDFPEARTSQDLSLVTELNPDVCVVATLAEGHVPIIEELAHLGVRRVLCEKPIVNSIADLARLKELLSQGDLVLAVNHPRLWADDHQQVRRLIERREFGDLEWVQSRFKPSGFGNIGVHSIASVLFLTGQSVTRVDAATFVETTALSRQAGHADYNGRAAFELGAVPFTADNRPTAVAARAHISLGFDDGRVDILEGSSTFRVLRRSTGLDQEERSSTAWGGGQKSNGAFCELLNRAILSLVTNDTRENLRCAFGAVEAVIAAQIAHAGRRAVSLPLGPEDGTPFLFS